MQQIVIPFGTKFSLESNPDTGDFILNIPMYLLHKSNDLILSITGEVYGVYVPGIVKPYGECTVERISGDNNFRITYSDYRDADRAFIDLNKKRPYGLSIRYE
jgi:hypothetical protein